MIFEVSPRTPFQRKNMNPAKPQTANIHSPSLYLYLLHSFFSKLQSSVLSSFPQPTTRFAPLPALLTPLFAQPSQPASQPVLNISVRVPAWSSQPVCGPSLVWYGIAPSSRCTLNTFFGTQLRRRRPSLTIYYYSINRDAATETPLISGFRF